MTITGDKVIFETIGREIYANGGIIGLAPDQNVFGGYDESFDVWYEDWMEGLEHYDTSVFNRQERLELADFMIARWQEFRKRAKAEVQLT